MCKVLEVIQKSLLSTELSQKVLHIFGNPHVTFHEDFPPTSLHVQQGRVLCPQRHPFHKEVSSNNSSRKSNSSKCGSNSNNSHDSNIRSNEIIARI